MPKYFCVIRHASVIDGKRKDKFEEREYLGSFKEIVQKVKNEYVQDPEHTKEQIFEAFGEAKWTTTYDYGHGNKTGCRITLRQVEESTDDWLSD